MKMSWGLADWLAFQESSHAQVIDMGLARVQVVAARLVLKSSPLFTITVAGTNGKGSSTAMLSSIYAAAGYKVGWYSSPHLLHYSERIRINNEPVSDGLLVEAFRAIAVVSQDLTLSYFEWGTLAALWIFKTQGCEIQVLEVGLGGRLDAVNVIDADAVLITPIDIDHQAYLGNTREVIAVEKAGIFRSGQVVVCSDTQPPRSLLVEAQGLGLSLLLSRKDFSWLKQEKGRWLWQAGNRVYALPQPALRGDFQLANAAGVLMLIESLQLRFPVSEFALTQGLSDVRLHGRLDARRCAEKNWLFDVAHNPQSVAALANYLADRSEPVIGIFSALFDKDISGMVAGLSPYVNQWFVAPLGCARGAPLDQLQTSFSIVDKARVNWCRDIAHACDLAQKHTSLSMRLVCGSFVTVEQGLAWLEGQSCSTP
jgi:dihydrofolate synthase/folylpolyglutamate synthase